MPEAIKNYTKKKIQIQDDIIPMNSHQKLSFKIPVMYSCYSIFIILMPILLNKIIENIGIANSLTKYIQLYG